MLGGGSLRVRLLLSVQLVSSSLMLPPYQINQQQTWHLVAKQLGWDVDVSLPTMTSPGISSDTTRLSTELAKSYQQLLRPFEEVWAKSLLKQQQAIANIQSNGMTADQISANAPALRAAAASATTGNALASMTPQQLLSFGFNASQVDVLKKPASALPPPAPPRAQSGQATNSNGTPAFGSWQQPPLNGITASPSLEQLSHARSMVAEMKASLDRTRREFSCPSFFA